jgi:soluble lytic murein transglycosylase
MPKTANWLSPKLEIEYSGIGSLYDPEYNIKLGVHYLNMMQNKFGDLDMALVAYNKGPKKLRNELDKGENLNSRFLEKVKAYYSDLKSTTEDYPA